MGKQIFWGGNGDSHGRVRLNWALGLGYHGGEYPVRPAPWRSFAYKRIDRAFLLTLTGGYGTFVCPPTFLKFS